MSDLDAVVIGAGVVGLAVGRALAGRSLGVAIAERERAIGTETSSRNSEVIHAGIYYPRGSLKARLCVTGRQALYAYCDEKSVPYRKCGKLIVATDDQEVQQLKAIRDNSARIGTTLQMLDRDALIDMEPQISAHAALFSPETGILDSHALMAQYLADFEDADGMLALASGVKSISPYGDDWRITMAGGEVTARWIINCAGLHASEIAGRVEGMNTAIIPETRFARGLYVRAAPSFRAQRLIYPVPSPGGLGVHATLDMAGTTRFGPDVEWIEDIDYSINESRIEDFRASIARYWPGVQDAELTPDYTGIRPKISAPSEPAADFAIWGPAQFADSRQIHLFGIESPGLTASLAIADLVADMIEPKGP